MDLEKMELETNLNEISSWTGYLTRKKLAFIGVGVLFLTVVCFSVIITASVKSSSMKTIATLSTGSVAEKMKSIKGEIEWVSYNSDNYSLTNAFAGGTGSNGKTVYVCRAKHLANNGKDKEVIPGTFDPTNALCKVPYGSISNPHSDFDLMIAKNPSRLVWESGSSEEIKRGAISGGNTANNKDLYIARFQYSGYTVLGELYSATNSYIASGPVGVKQVYKQTFDLLCIADYAL